MRSATLLSWIVIFLGCCSQLNEGLRILVISPMNSKSHDAMSDRLAKGLAKKGHQVDAYTHYPPKKPIPNYKHHSLDGILKTYTNNLNYSEATQFQVSNPREIFKKISDPVCSMMELPLFEQLLKNPPTDPPYDIFIIQIFIADCYLAWGRHLNVPTIGVSSISTLDWYNKALGNPFNTAVTVGFGTDIHPPMNFWERLYNTGKSAFLNFMFLQIMAEQGQFVDRIFGPGYPGINELRRDLDLLIINSHHSLDGIKAYTPAIIPSAGIHIDYEDNTKLPSEVQKWLDDSKDGCIYFTFGSMVRIETLPKLTLDTIYATFKNIAPVRVLMKIANPKDLPAGLPANVMTQSWFSQLQVFKHKNIKAFITHGGMMSSLEAIHSRVPMIGVPIFGDQPHNVKMNVKKGISTFVEIDTVDVQKLTAAIKEVLYNPTYRKNMDELSEKFNDRPLKPLENAIYWVEYVAKHGKKCLRSPLVDMPWWQANLLDVYAFVLFVLLLIYYTLKLLIKKIYNTCCANKAKSPSNKLESKKKL